MMPHPKKLLVLDLDETLIYATETPLARAADFRAGRFHVYKRPHLDGLVSACLEHFAVAVWTSASPSFAAAVVRACFPDPAALRFVWASDRCTWSRDGETGAQIGCKHLTKLTRRGWAKEAILAVDDTPEKWARSYGNLVPIRPWYGDPNDNELARLAPYLLTLKNVPNVRTLEKRDWHRSIQKL